MKIVLCDENLLIRNNIEVFFFWQSGNFKFYQFAKNNFNQNIKISLPTFCAYTRYWLVVDARTHASKSSLYASHFHWGHTYVDVIFDKKNTRVLLNRKQKLMMRGVILNTRYVIAPRKKIWIIRKCRINDSNEKISNYKRNLSYRYLLVIVHIL